MAFCKSCEKRWAYSKHINRFTSDGVECLNCGKKQ